MDRVAWGLTLKCISLLLLPYIFLYPFLFSTTRESLTDVLLFKIGFLSFPLLGIPPEIMIFVGIHYLIHDNWIHLNVKWHSWMKYIEWFYVTPRFHAVHHTETGSNTKNLGALFTIFDRIFGTYVNPEQLTDNQVQFASGENAVVTVRKIVGV